MATGEEMPELPFGRKAVEAVDKAVEATPLEDEAAAYKSLRAELATIFGPVQPHHGMTWNASMLARIGEVLAEREKPFQIRFDGPPGPEAGRFIEVEDREGKSIRKGRWDQDGEHWLLIIE